MLSSVRSLKRKWFCPVEKFGVFQQYRHTATVRTGLQEGKIRHIAIILHQAAYAPGNSQILVHRTEVPRSTHAIRQ